MLKRHSSNNVKEYHTNHDMTDNYISKRVPFSLLSFETSVMNPTRGQGEPK